MKDQNYAVIMAGGIGSRFWPMSTAEFPKQFLDILGTGRSLLQQTFDRLLKLCPVSNIYIVTNENYRQITQAQLPEISEFQILCEPDRRNTAPCIAYAGMVIQKRNPNANVIVASSDHLIIREDDFVEMSRRSLEYVSSRDVLLTIGIKPSRPDTGYGYINFEKGKSDFMKVKSFTEKPVLEKARFFLESGDYCWNSGIFIWNVQSIQKAFQQFLPEMVSAFEKGQDKIGNKEEVNFIRDVYRKVENISIDFAIMEKAKNVEVIIGDIGWSDLGTWGSLYDHIPHDNQKNALVGKNILARNSSGNIVHVSGEKLVVLQGLKDFIVIDQGNTLLICKKDEEQEIKKIVEEVSKRP